MKKNLLLTITIAVFVISEISCGGNDDDSPGFVYKNTENENQQNPQKPESEKDRMIRESYELFGLKKEDFDTCYISKSKGKIYVTGIKKSDNSVFVGLYDSSTKFIYFKDDQIKVNPIEYVQYYENNYACTIQGVEYQYVETENGRVLYVSLKYWNAPNSAERVTRNLPILYFYDGNRTTPLKLNFGDVYYLYKWYSNSCVIVKNDYLTCYTDDGKEQCSFKSPLHRHGFTLEEFEEYNILISYSDFISYKTYSALNNKYSFLFYRYDLLKQNNVWMANLDIINDIGDKVRISYEYEKNYPLWKFTVKLVSEDGKTKSGVISINIETGESKEINA